MPLLDHRVTAGRVVCSGGNSVSGSPGSDDGVMATVGVASPHEGIVFGEGAGWRGTKVELGCIFCIDDGESRQRVALQGLRDGCMMMDVRKEVTLSGGVVASTAGLARSMR